MGLKTFIYKQADKIQNISRFWDKKYGKKLPHVELKKVGQYFAVNIIHKSQSRGYSTAKMIIDCIPHLNTEKDFNFRFFINDQPFKTYENTDFYYCTDDCNKIAYLIPDYSFDHWKEAGIANFNSTIEDIKAASKKPWEVNKIFWIGNTETNPMRKELLSIAQKNTNILEVIDTFVDNYFVHKQQVAYISLPEHTKYKYLIDIEGIGFSCRLKFLLFTKRLLFLQDRQWKEFFWFDLQPYVHFIPVKNDLSNLILQYEMIESNPKLYEDIVENAYQYACANLTYDSAISTMIKTIQNRIDTL